jgi:uracil-DNA glycosylase family protein
VSERAERRVRELARRAEACTDCDLYRNATQAVFGRGPAPTRIFMMGEQPGDHEDVEGEPFVGPAGKLLRDACGEVGLDLDRVYLTNAVKHFKWERSGKVRLHKPPNSSEVRACRQWWEAELEVVRPEIVCCLGAVAARACFGPSFRVTKERGVFVRLDDRNVDGFATVHPSSVLRARPGERKQARAAFLADLGVLAQRQ